MKKINKNWFTLVELLVVITILTIISVVAYQNFWWATDKALSGRKINDVATIESALLQYNSDKNYYPATWLYDENNNVWWYNSWSIATPSNKLSITLNWEEIDTISTWSSIWWWKIVWSGSLWQIWAKWIIWQNELWKKFLSKDLYDPEIWDKIVKTPNKKMIEYWVWRYVYWVYNNTDWNTWNRVWKAYNIAFTVKDTQNDTYKAKIVWDYDEKSCWNNELNCPKTLIWSFSWLTLSTDYTWNPFLLNDDNNDVKSLTGSDQWIPYPVNIQ